MTRGRGPAKRELASVGPAALASRRLPLDERADSERAPMADEDLGAKIEEMIAESLGVPREQVKPESAFLADLQADSLDILELVLKLEKAYGLSIPEQDARKIRTVQDVIDYIAAHQAAHPGG
jgi:acyl carrier protein